MVYPLIFMMISAIALSGILFTSGTGIPEMLSQGPGFGPIAGQAQLANPALSGLVAQSIWQRFTSSEGRFSVLFPGAPSVLQRSVLYAPGQTTEVHAFYVERPQEATAYAVSYNDFPFGDTVSAAVLERAFDNGRDRMVGSAKLLAEQAITLGTVPGRAFKFIKADGKVTRVRMYYVNGRLYQLIVETDREKYLTKSLEGFFNSFQLLAP